MILDTNIILSLRIYMYIEEDQKKQPGKQSECAAFSIIWT